MSEAAESEQQETKAAAVWEQVSTLLAAVAIALAIRAFVIEPFRIPSGSMLPTLLIGDHLFVSKFVYGVKLPFSEYRLPKLRDPRRGDVVVFTVAKSGSQTFPADQRPDLRREEFVKRIVGLPGDRIQIRDGVVSVNGQPVDVQPLDETFSDERGTELDVKEVSVDGRSYRVLDDRRVSLRDPPPITVPEGRYFMMGDNRDHSQDSRAWDHPMYRPEFMTVRLAEMKGPAYRLYWSWDFNGSWGDLLNPITWVELMTERMRWDRIGDRVR